MPPDRPRQILAHPRLRGSRGTHPRCSSPGHTQIQQPRDLTRPQQTDASPFTQATLDAHAQVAHRRCIPQISGLATVPDQRRPMLSHPPRHPRRRHPGCSSLEHTTNQRPCYTTKPPETDPFPSIPCHSRGVPPGGSWRGIPQMGGCAVLPDRRRRVLPTHSLPSRGIHPGCSSPGVPQIRGHAMPLEQRRQILPIQSLPFPRHSPLLLIAGHAANQRPCDSTGLPQTYPSHAFPSTLEALTRVAR
jgi:hypothetical protein